MNHNSPLFELQDLQDGDPNYTENRVLRRKLQERRDFRKLRDMFDEYVGEPCGTEITKSGVLQFEEPAT